MISTVWTREDIPYDAMGDYSRFCFAGAKEEDLPRLPRAESENENEGNNVQLVFLSAPDRAHDLRGSRNSGQSSDVRYLSKENRRQSAA